MAFDPLIRRGTLAAGTVAPGWPTDAGVTGAEIGARPGRRRHRAS